MIERPVRVVIEREPTGQYCVSFVSDEGEPLWTRYHTINETMGVVECVLTGRPPDRQVRKL